MGVGWGWVGGGGGGLDREREKAAKVQTCYISVQSRFAYSFVCYVRRRTRRSYFFGISARFAEINRFTLDVSCDLRADGTI